MLYAHIATLAFNNNAQLIIINLYTDIVRERGYFTLKYQAQTNSQEFQHAASSIYTFRYTETPFTVGQAILIIFFTTQTTVLLFYE